MLSVSVLKEAVGGIRGGGSLTGRNRDRVCGATPHTPVSPAALLLVAAAFLFPAAALPLIVLAGLLQAAYAVATVRGVFGTRPMEVNVTVLDEYGRKVAHTGQRARPVAGPRSIGEEDLLAMGMSAEDLKQERERRAQQDLERTNVFHDDIPAEHLEVDGQRVTPMTPIRGNLSTRIFGTPTTNNNGGE